MKLGVMVQWAVPIIVSILILGTLGLSQDAFAAGFLKFAEIDGESSDQAHDKWIDILSVDFNDLRTITVSKDIDSSTPKLIEAACKGDESDPGFGVICDGFSVTEPPDPSSDVPLVLPDWLVEIDICRTTHGKELQCYLRFELQRVRVTSYSISGSTEGDQVPTENFSLTFQEIKVTYTEFDDKGKKGGNIEYTWKVEEGES